MSKSRFIVLILFVLIIVVLVADSLGFFNRTYRTEISINNVASDSIFDATLTNRLTGNIPDADRSGCQLSIRAVGEIDDSTKILVNYINGSHLSYSLPKGKIDTLWSGDFYASTARATFLHQHAKRGRLTLNIEFSLPPESWGSKVENGVWRKI